MSSPPPRGWSRLQALLLADVRAFDKNALKPTPEIRVTTLLGELRVETHEDVYIKVSSLRVGFILLHVPHFRALADPSHPFTDRGIRRRRAPEVD